MAGRTVVSKRSETREVEAREPADQQPAGEPDGVEHAQPRRVPSSAHERAVEQADVEGALWATSTRPRARREERGEGGPQRPAAAQVAVAMPVIGGDRRRHAECRGRRGARTCPSSRPRRARRRSRRCARSRPTPGRLQVDDAVRPPAPAAAASPTRPPGRCRRPSARRAARRRARPRRPRAGERDGDPPRPAPAAAPPRPAATGSCRSWSRWTRRSAPSSESWSPPMRTYVRTEGLQQQPGAAPVRARRSSGRAAPPCAPRGVGDSASTCPSRPP